MCHEDNVPDGTSVTQNSQPQQQALKIDTSNSDAPSNSDGTWIFGFGSLIHNPSFEHSRRIEGCIKGWRRVFWQGSTDHRGTPGAPGRTATVVESRGSIVWGAAYLLGGSSAHQNEILKYLEHREKQYDQRFKVDVLDHDKHSVLVKGALMYIATPDRNKNVNWLGEASVSDMAVQIANAHGPSGPNDAYLFHIADDMRKMQVDDPELFELEAAVLALKDTKRLKQAQT